MATPRSKAQPLRRVVLVLLVALGCLGSSASAMARAKHTYYPVQITLKIKQVPVPGYPELIAEQLFGKVTSLKRKCQSLREVIGLVSFIPSTEPLKRFYFLDFSDADGFYEAQSSGPEPYPRPMNISAKVKTLRLPSGDVCRQASSRVLKLRN